MFACLCETERETRDREKTERDRQTETEIEGVTERNTCSCRRREGAHELMERDAGRHWNFTYLDKLELVT